MYATQAPQPPASVQAPHHPVQPPTHRDQYNCLKNSIFNWNPKAFDKITEYANAKDNDEENDEEKKNNLRELAEDIIKV